MKRLSCLASLLMFSAIAFQGNVFAQCAGATGDQVTFGAGSWIGYVYDGVNSFTTATYNGTITQPEIFDYSFCGDNCNFNTSGGACQVNSETFSVRFKMRKTYTCGTYQFTIGGDDGVRLSIDGVYIIDYYTDHSYGTATGTAYLTAGSHDLILEYYENATQNRVSYTYSNLGIAGNGGVIAASQTFCQVGNIDPAAFTSTTAAQFCAGGTTTYTWQSSTDNVTYNNIASSNSATYDAPSMALAGTLYYRRRAVRGAVTVYSNVITVVGDSPQGNAATFPAANSGWIGYVYDGANNFASNYQGYFNEASLIFDESFCGDNCTFAINGCDINTETFTVRFRYTLNVVTAAGYTFTIGGDDGVRLSVDGVTVASDFVNHGYQTTSSAVINLSTGNHQLVLDYYEDGGGNRVTFSYATGPLPVTWSFLDGYCQDGKNFLDWRTASELNNEGFEIQRSTDGVQFDSIGYVAGNGTSSLEHSYTFTDVNPVQGWNYYRLKQIDYDKKFEYSRLVPVQVNTLPTSFIYPNPASAELFVSRLNPKESLSVVLKNVITGRTYHVTQDPQQPSRFLLDKVEPGIYVATFSMGMKVISEKIVIY